MPLAGHEAKEPASSEHLNVADASVSEYVKDAVRDVVAALGPERITGVGVTGAVAARTARAPVAATATAAPRASATLPLFILLTCHPPPVWNASPVPLNRARC